LAAWKKPDPQGFSIPVMDHVFAGVPRLDWHPGDGCQGKRGWFHRTKSAVGLQGKNMQVLGTFNSSKEAVASAYQKALELNSDLTCLVQKQALGALGNRQMLVRISFRKGRPRIRKKLVARNSLGVREGNVFLATVRSNWFASSIQLF
jgi:hypothetical protein